MKVEDTRHYVIILLLGFFLSQVAGGNLSNVSGEHYTIPMALGRAFGFGLTLGLILMYPLKKWFPVSRLLGIISCVLGSSIGTFIKYV